MTSPTSPAKTVECPQHYLTVCVELPKGVTVEDARDAIRKCLGTTPEIILEIAIKDSRSQASRCFAEKI